MQYKPIKIWHVENAILGWDFNPGVIGFFFHAFTLMDQVICSKIYNVKNWNNKRKNQCSKFGMWLMQAS